MPENPRQSPWPSWLLDMDGDGRLEIVGRPLHGPYRWQVHVFHQE